MDAQNTCLSNSTGNLAQLAASGDAVESGILQLPDDSGGHDLSVMDLQPEFAPTGSLCDLRFGEASEAEPSVPFEINPAAPFTVEVVPETVPEKRVVFEVDTKAPPSIYGDCTADVVSNTSTVNSTCVTIGKDAYRILQNDAVAGDTSETNSQASSESGSAESVIDSVRMSNGNVGPQIQRLFQANFGLRS